MGEAQTQVEAGRAPARSRVWRLLALGGPIGFLGAMPYFLPLFEQMSARAREAGKTVTPLPVIALAQLVQVSLLVALAAWVGGRLAPKAGLDAPWLRAMADRAAWPGRFRAELPRALLIGLAFSAVILALNHAAGPHLPEVMREKPLPPMDAGPEALELLRGASSAFYGGIIEEILLRWGLLAGLAALFRRAGNPGFWLANLLSALLFGAGHLPAVASVGVALTAPIVAYVIAANALAGLCCGWLFRSRGLEAAMVAHGFGDICLHAIPLALPGALLSR